MSRKRADEVLAEWDDRLFNIADVRRRKGRIERGPTGLTKPSCQPLANPLSLDIRANRMRKTLLAVTRRVPEVMVKISGGGKGMRQINAHLSYISRNGRIALEDQEGTTTGDRRELVALSESWQNGGFPIPIDGPVREAFNIVLSMPEGTDEVALLRAARDFAAKTFANHQYAMALHTFDTDPDPMPARHPHVHLVVKARGLDGARLNPRRADLQAWRETFARALGEHGIEAVATPRRLRQQPVRGQKIASLKSGERIRGVKRRGHKLRDADPQFNDLLEALSESDDRDDRRLAAAFRARTEVGVDRDRGR